MPIFRKRIPGIPGRRQEMFWWSKPKGARLRGAHRMNEKLGSQMSKRRRFVLVAIILTAGLYVIQRLPVETRVGAIGILGLLSYSLSMWSLRRDLVGAAWVTNLLLPTWYPVAVAGFYFLLPQSAVTRGVVLLLFLISMYALLLTVNIFAVATNRTIQLLRAARTVGFLLSVITTALLYQVVFSMNLPFWGVTGLSVLISLPIFLQGVWGYTLSTRLGRGEILYAMIGTILLLEMTLAVCFWEIEPLLASVMLSMMMYVLLGLFQHEVDKRLFHKTTQEYVGFALIVFVIVAAAVLLRWLA